MDFMQIKKERFKIVPLFVQGNTCLRGLVFKENKVLILENGEKLWLKK